MCVYVCLCVIVCVYVRSLWRGLYYVLRDKNLLQRTTRLSKARTAIFSSPVIASAARIQPYPALHKESVTSPVGYAGAQTKPRHCGFVQWSCARTTSCSLTKETKRVSPPLIQSNSNISIGVSARKTDMHDLLNNNTVSSGIILRQAAGWWTTLMEATSK